MPDRASRAQVSLIHVLASRVGLIDATGDDSGYREMLTNFSGRRSSRDLTPLQARRVIAHLLGDPSGGESRPRTPRARRDRAAAPQAAQDAQDGPRAPSPVVAMPEPANRAEPAAAAPRRASAEQVRRIWAIGYRVLDVADDDLVGAIRRFVRQTLGIWLLGGPEAVALDRLSHDQAASVLAHLRDLARDQASRRACTGDRPVAPTLAPARRTDREIGPPAAPQEAPEP